METVIQIESGSQDSEFSHIPGWGEWPPERRFIIPKTLERLGRRAGLTAEDVRAMLNISSRAATTDDLHSRIKERRIVEKFRTLVLDRV